MFKKKFIKDETKKVTNSFKYAFNGLFSSFESERNMKIHFIIMIFVIIMGYILNISYYEWLICTLLFGIVISLEMVNTAIETVVDLAMPTINEKAKIAKDIAAGAVLVTAFTSAVIGIIIFLPKIFILF